MDMVQETYLSWQNKVSMLIKEYMIGLTNYISCWLKLHYLLRHWLRWWESYTPDIETALMIKQPYSTGRRDQLYRPEEYCVYSRTRFKFFECCMTTCNFGHVCISGYFKVWAFSIRSWENNCVLLKKAFSLLPECVCLCMYYESLVYMPRTFWSNNLKESDHLEDLGVDESIILKIITEIQCVWNRFRWLWIGSNGGPSWTR
jgi:hypothetical protein